MIDHMHIIYDAGEMVNVGIELGQIEGGYFTNKKFKRNFLDKTKVFCAVCQTASEECHSINHIFRSCDVSWLAKIRRFDMG